MFLHKNLFFSISSVISIPIMLIGINGRLFSGNLPGMFLYRIWACSDRNERFRVVNLSFRQIWRFLISFADFSTKLLYFGLLFCFTALSAI